MGAIYYLLDPEKLEAFELGKTYFSEKHLHDLDHLDDTIEGTYELAVRLLVSIGFGRRPGDVAALAHSPEAGAFSQRAELFFPHRHHRRLGRDHVRRANRLERLS